MPGAPASQNSSPVVNWKPILGSSRTTTLHIIHTAKDNSNGGIEKNRLRKAIARPVFCQKASSSGRQSRNQRRRPAATGSNSPLTI